MDYSRQIEERLSNCTWRFVFITLASFCMIMALMEIFISTAFRYDLIGLAKKQANRTNYPINRWLANQHSTSFFEIDYSARKSDYFDIAWISGSSISIRDAPENYRINGRKNYSLARVLNDYLEDVDGKDVSVHRYLMQGARSGDIRRAVLHAQGQETIDLILLPINPLWIFNEWLMYSTSNQKGDAVFQSGANREDWVDVAKVSSPLELGMTWAERNMALFYMRPKIGKMVAWKKLPNFLAEYGGTHKGHKGPGFWINYFYGPSIYEGVPKGAETYKSYRSNTFTQNFSEESIGRKLLRANIQGLSKSGKMVLIYLPPMPPSLKEDAKFTNALGEIEKIVTKNIAEAGATNVKFTSEFAFGARQPYDHRDIIHLHYGHGLVTSLVNKLEVDFELAIHRKNERQIYKANK